MTERVDINRLLMEMRTLKSQAQAFPKPQGLAAKDVVGGVENRAVNVESKQDVPSFGSLVEQAINRVNDLQKTSGALSTAYTQGEPNIDITDVMVASQKAGVSFQAMVQVRNKLIEAYRDVMNMPL